MRNDMRSWGGIQTVWDEHAAQNPFVCAAIFTQSPRRTRTNNAIVLSVAVAAAITYRRDAYARD